MATKGPKVTTLADIKAQMALLQKQHDEIVANEKANVIAEMKEKISDYGITATELGFQLSAPTTTVKPPKSAPTGKTKAEAKYRGPNNEEWAGGIGARPKWVKAILEAGGNIEDYRIKKEETV